MAKGTQVWLCVSVCVCVDALLMVCKAGLLWQGQAGSCVWFPGSVIHPAPFIHSWHGSQ
jgi:hypothetical protein